MPFHVRIGATVTGIRRTSDGVTLTLEDGGTVEVDEVLFATRRRPLTDDIGLQAVGIKLGSWLAVDDTCAVLATGDDKWLYALGDVNRHALLTHQGKYQARIVGAVIAARAAGQPVDPARGARTRSPPTIKRCRWCSSATRKPARSA